MKQDVFLVLRETSMPACLIELGFITTPDEERMLNDQASVDNIARGIYNAFAKYKNDNSTGFTVPYEATSSTQPKIPTIVPKDYKDDNKAPKEQMRTRATARSAAKKQQDADNETKKPASADKQEAQAASTRQESGNTAAKNTSAQNGGIIFKVQVLASTATLPANSPRFKGHSDVSSYKENGMVKYTIGASADYNEINRLRQSLADDFQGCFVVAFKDGEKMNIAEAIREFKKNK